MGIKPIKDGIGEFILFILHIQHLFFHTRSVAKYGLLSNEFERALPALCPCCIVGMNSVKVVMNRRIRTDVLLAQGIITEAVLNRRKIADVAQANKQKYCQ